MSSGPNVRRRAENGGEFDGNALRRVAVGRTSRIKARPLVQNLNDMNVATVGLGVDFTLFAKANGVVAFEERNGRRLVSIREEAAS